VIAPAISLPAGRMPRLDAMDLMLGRSIRERTFERRLSDKIKAKIRLNAKSGWHCRARRI